jgi:hypothetical protein
MITIDGMAQRMTRSTRAESQNQFSVRVQISACTEFLDDSNLTVETPDPEGQSCWCMSVHCSTVRPVRANGKMRCVSAACLAESAMKTS